MSKMEFNEATLEAEVHKLIGILFPNVKKTITHQTSFRIKLGHTTSIIDGKKNWLKGISDIIIKSNGKSIVLVELKKNGHKINRQDIDQALSYARLSFPMIPITIVSDGHEIKILNTYLGSTIEQEKFDLKTIKQILANNIELSNIDIEDAAKSLLGKHQEIWKVIIDSITQKSIKLLEGDILEYRKPLVSGFSVRRKVISCLLENISKNQIVYLTGEPFCGKTNIVSELLKVSKKDDELVMLYIGKTNNYGIFQVISNYLFNEAKIIITPQEVRNWLISLFNEETKSRLVIIVDNCKLEEDSILIRELKEIVDINEKIKILLTMNKSIYLERTNRSLSEEPLWTMGKEVGIDILDDEEYYDALKIIKGNYSISFENGAQNSLEYRSPKILRSILISILKHQKHKNAQIKKGETIRVDSIPGFSFIKFWGDLLEKNNVVNIAYDIIVEKILNDSLLDKEHPHLNLISHGTGIIQLKSISDRMKFIDLERLQIEGIIDIQHIPGDEVIIIPFFPEFIAFKAIQALSKRIRKLWTDNPAEAFKYLLKYAELFPFSDIVGAQTIITFYEDQEIYNYFINELLSKEPSIIKLDENSSIMIYVPKVGFIKIEGDLSDSRLIENYSWLILSRLLFIPQKDSSNSYKSYLYLLSKVGSYKGLLRRIDAVDPKNMKSFLTHEISDELEVICHNSGVVEPIVLAMKRAFIKIPTEMDKLITWAISEKNISLIWRLYLANLSLIGIAQKDLLGIINETNWRLLNAIKKLIGETYTLI